MMYPKPVKKKKRKQHKKSILQERDGRCFLCMLLNQDYRIHEVLHKHHVYGGPNRSISEAEGFTVDLCLEHHETGDAAVHNNQEYMRLLQQVMQRKYEEAHSREEFMQLIHRNYLEEPEMQRDTKTETWQRDTEGFKFLEEE